MNHVIENNNNYSISIISDLKYKTECSQRIKSQTRLCLAYSNLSLAWLDYFSILVNKKMWCKKANLLHHAEGQVDISRQKTL